VESGGAGREMRRREICALRAGVATRRYPTLTTIKPS